MRRQPRYEFVRSCVVLDNLSIARCWIEDRIEYILCTAYPQCICRFLCLALFGQKWPLCQKNVLIIISSICRFQHELLIALFSHVVCLGGTLEEGMDSGHTWLMSCGVETLLTVNIELVSQQIRETWYLSDNEILRVWADQINRHSSTLIFFFSIVATTFAYVTWRHGTSCMTCAWHSTLYVSF